MVPYPSLILPVTIINKKARLVRSSAGNFKSVVDSGRYVSCSLLQNTCLNVLKRSVATTHTDLGIYSGLCEIPENYRHIVCGKSHKDRKIYFSAASALALSNNSACWDFESVFPFESHASISTNRSSQWSDSK